MAFGASERGQRKLLRFHLKCVVYFGTLGSMKRSFYIGLSGLILMNAMILGTAMVTEANTCRVGEAPVCYDRSLDAYAIEPEAHVSVQVLNADHGEALVKLWNDTHPQQPGVVSYTLVNDGQVSDIRYLSQEQAAFEYETLYPLEDTENIDFPLTISPELNTPDVTFIPMAGEGFAFVTNKSALETLGVVWEDVDKDNLIDSLSDFESIISTQARWTTDKQKLVFSMSEPYAFYPFLSAGGWEIFSSYDGYAPGFEQAEFLESLRFIDALSQVNWNNSETNTADTYVWDFSESLKADDFLFNIVSSWMYLETYQSRNGSEWMVSRFPSMNAQSEPLSPFLSEVRGYSISKETVFPSAAHEVMRLIRSDLGIQVFVDTTTEIPLASKEVLDKTVFTNNLRAQYAQAFIHSQSEPLIALVNQPNIPAFRLYLEIELMPTIRSLWNQEITPEEAQIQIAMASDAWLFQHSSLNESEVEVNEP
jgi:arabinogalactan oligomer/maltooligosaccharide transport system substrate-binding protein